jgi:hypothetical protein
MKEVRLPQVGRGIKKSGNGDAPLPEMEEENECLIFNTSRI